MRCEHRDNPFAWSRTELLVGGAFLLVFGALIGIAVNVFDAMRRDVPTPRPSDPRDQEAWVALDDADRIAEEWIARRESVPMCGYSVRLVGDEEYRRSAGSDWQADARRRIARASAVLLHEFRISLRCIDAVEWTSDDEAPSVLALHRAVADEFVAEAGPDLVVAFTGQTSARGKSGYVEGGVGEYLGRCCLVRTGVLYDAVVQDSVLLHELGHVFGCRHSYTSVMAPAVELLRMVPERLDFDLPNVAAVSLLRDRPAHGGFEHIPKETRDAVLRIYRWCKRLLQFRDASGHDWLDEGGGGPPDDR